MLESLFGFFQQLGQITGYRNRVVVIPRIDGVINVEVLYPRIRLSTVNHPLTNRQEQAPDGDILFAA